MPHRLMGHNKYIICMCKKNNSWLDAIFSWGTSFEDEMLSHDVISRLFDEKCDDSGSDSGGELLGTVIYAY